MRGRLRVAMALGFLIALSTGSWADEAVLRTGRRVEGTLGRDAQGRLAFTPTGNKAPLSADQIQYVSFAARPFKPLSTAVYHRATLTDGQALTGELLSLDDKNLRLRTTWAEELTLPRGAVAAVKRPGNLATLWVEDFEAELKDWKITGHPPIGEGDSALGKKSLVLKEAGQAAAYSLPTPVAAGWFNFAFRLPDKTTGLRWRVELDFPPHTALIELGGEGPSFTASAPGESETVPPVPRSPGWHRLDVEFSPSSLVVSIDGLAIWYDRTHGPKVPLSRLRFACIAEGGGDPKGGVAFDEVGLATSVKPLRHTPGDPKQDEVWLKSGDSLFGKVSKADRRRITLQAGSGERVKDLLFDWAEVRGLFLREDRGPQRKPDAETVRLRLRREIGTEADEIEGVVRGLDDKHLTLAHPLLGELKIGRERIDQLRWVKD